MLDHIQEKGSRIPVSFRYCGLQAYFWSRQDIQYLPRNAVLRPSA